jgi:hypothetical protein
MDFYSLCDFQLRRPGKDSVASLWIFILCNFHLRRPGKDYVSITEEMHESNLAVLRRNEFDIVVERFGIPVSQHDMLTLTDTNWLNDHIIGMQQHRFSLLCYGIFLVGL